LGIDLYHLSWKFPWPVHSHQSFGRFFLMIGQSEHWLVQFLLGIDLCDSSWVLTGAIHFERWLVRFILAIEFTDGQNQHSEHRLRRFRSGIEDMCLQTLPQNPWAPFLEKSYSRSKLRECDHKQWIHLSGSRIMIFDILCAYRSKNF
jgi:hypothetical protein